MHVVLGMKIDETLQALFGDADSIAFTQANSGIVQEIEHGAGHELHAHPEVVFPEAGFSDLNQVGVAQASHNTQLSEDVGMVRLVLIFNIASLDGYMCLCVLS